MSSPKPVPLTFGIELEFTSASKQDVHDATDFYSHGFEPLVARVESMAAIQVNVQENGKGEMDYSRHTFTNDGSVSCTGWDFETPPLPTDSEQHQWLVKSAEFVSRILPAPLAYTQETLSSAPAFLELKRILRALKSTPSSCFWSSTNPTCGFHVHVGVDPTHALTHNSPSSTSGTIPLPTLQHLAMFLIRFEPLISHLHSPSRCGPSRYASNCMTNTSSFHRDAHVCTRKARLASPREIRECIFHPNMTSRGLARRMGDNARLPLKFKGDEQKCHDEGFPTRDRCRIVNWMGLAREPGEQTLEFRQADGTLDAEEVVHWVSFCVQVVRACERLAGVEEDQLEVWREREFKEATLDEMLDLLGIEDPGLRAYWCDRARRWPPAQVEDEFAGPVEWSRQCGECERVKRHRAIARKQRTVFQKGWRGNGNKWRKLTKGEKKALKQRQRNKSRSLWKAKEAERLKEGRASAESVLWGHGDVECLVEQFGKVSDWCDAKPMDAGRTPGCGW